jgi:pSer/pThr/pTyr-binding forkhead associated (FHA) protein
MKQYWTPLARWLGMAKSERNEVTDAVALAASVWPDVQHPSSPWPDLFQALREHAQSNWVVRSQRHAEIDSQQCLAITSLHIRAISPELDAQLRQWFSEGEVPQLVQWMARGPWHTPEIERWVSWEGLTQVVLLPMGVPVRHESSPYDVNACAARSPALAYEIEADTQWCSRSQPAEEPHDWLPLELRIDDALGQRSVYVMQTLMVLGAEKTLQTADGSKLEIKDQSPVLWGHETAWFVALSAQHVSGLHLVVRRQKDCVTFSDASSTNGTFMQGHRLEAGQWHTVRYVETLFLGGPASDSRQHAARVELRVGHPVQPMVVDRTPLRIPVADVAPPLLMLLPYSGPHKTPVAVRALPFTVGRGADCDWVIAPEFEMVSRHHLVIEVVDVPRQMLKLRDLSSQGLTHSQKGWQGVPADGVWVAWSDVISLGKTSKHMELSFGIAAATLSNN